MEKFMQKYSFWLTTLLSVIAAIWLIAIWDNTDIITKLPVVYIIALGIHTIEELKLPGGFVELVTSMTGIQINNLGVAKFGLFMLILYATVIPTFLSHLIWPVMATLLVGIVEIFAHMVAARVNPHLFYSPGLYTAVIVQFPVAIYGYYYLLSNDLVEPIYWLYAAIFLLVPLFSLQAVIVKSNGMNYFEFIKMVRRALFTAVGQQETREKIK